MIRIALFFISSIALSACTTAYTVSVSPSSNEQTTRYFDGVPAVISELANSVVVVIPPAHAVEKRGRFGIVSVNRGTNPINFGSENVAVEAADGAHVHVYSYAELLDEEKSRQAWAAVAAALAAAGNSMQAANAGYTTSYGSYTGSTYGTYGGSPYSATTYGSGYVTTYDPAKAQAAQATANQQNIANLKSVQMANALNERRLQEILKTTTISPGDSHSGEIVFDVPQGTGESKYVSVLVSAGVDRHVFNVRLSASR
ncbi:hypothetical protein [Parvibaculum sp.]|jgi:hypothetical protein|uniref:hypothetical protein n=1 Tax=Parvibaculum sp. TaxID=2024848 RepID=UPI0025DE8C73|nr:hypothetical protein [Parvibaculum sp.]|tara:strand:+ start:18390 stop:19160 length:771 start_codon:yes stop_codon:yes gene_type:complete